METLQARKPRRGGEKDDADCLGALQTADSLASRLQHVDGRQPLIQRNVRPLKNGARANGAPYPAGVAPMIRRPLLTRCMLAVRLRGDDAARPSTAFHAGNGRGFVWRLPEEPAGVDGGFRLRVFAFHVVPFHMKAKTQHGFSCGAMCVISKNYIKSKTHVANVLHTTAGTRRVAFDAARAVPPS